MSSEIKPTHTGGSERSSPVHCCPPPVCVGMVLIKDDGEAKLKWMGATFTKEIKFKTKYSEF